MTIQVTLLYPDTELYYTIIDKAAVPGTRSVYLEPWRLSYRFKYDLHLQPTQLGFKLTNLI